ncbi:MAG: ribonuclease H-like domain-containing protein [Planctomycetota bacterium]|nr:ribonuclease H-like domain-containing protein [Planctomycetota bacterium]
MPLTPLERTFCHVNGIGLRTEKKLWEAGATSWYDIDASDCGELPAGTLRAARREAETSRRKYFDRDIYYFVRKLPPAEQWRVFASVPGPTAYIDIETTGTSLSSSAVTIIGLFDGEASHIYMHEFRDLRERPPLKKTKYPTFISSSAKFERKMAETNKYVTFNGKSFDVPILRRYFPDVDFRIPHLDLKIAMRAVGIRGGLKSIEKQLGVARPGEVNGLSGRDAVDLWARYRTLYDMEALARLIEYNVQDIVNLPRLEQVFFEKRMKDLPPDTTILTN